MRAVISLALAILMWPIIDILVYLYDFGTFPSELIWIEVFFEELLFSIGITLFFWAIFYGILYAIASYRKKKRLAPLMSRELPWHIQNDDDMFALTMKFGGSAVKSKAQFRNLRTFIQPGEKLFFATARTQLFIHGINEPSGDGEMGDLFLSDQRVVIVNSLSEVKVLPVRDIVSIVSEDAAFAFCTEKTNVSFTPILNGINANDVYNIFNRVLTEAGVELIPTITPSFGGGIIPEVQTQTTVDCPGCGAAITVTVGQTSQCEYCSRFVGAAE